MSASPFASLVSRHNVRKGVVTTHKPEPSEGVPSGAAAAGVAIGGFDAEFLQGISGQVVQPNEVAAPPAPDPAPHTPQDHKAAAPAASTAGLDFLKFVGQSNKAKPVTAPALPDAASSGESTAANAQASGAEHSAPNAPADKAPAVDSHSSDAGGDPTSAKQDPQLHAAGAAVFSRRTPFAAQAQAPRQYGSSNSPVSSLASGPNSSAVRELRADIKSANIVTELVAAISRYPGSHVPVGVKTQILTNLLVNARRAAVRVAAVVDPERCNFGWVRAHALEMMAIDVARHWEQMASSQGSIDNSLDERALASLEERTECVVQVLSTPDDDLRDSINMALQAAMYNEVSDDQSALDHRLVAINRLAWVMSDLLDGAPVDVADARQSVVQQLCAAVLTVVNTSKPDIADAEAASSYFRGACMRVAKLVKAEFSRQFKERVEPFDAHAFEQRVLPSIVESVRRDFLCIESAARVLLTNLDRHETNNLRGGSDR